MEGLASPALDHSPAHGLNASTRRPGAMAVSGGGGSGATGSISPFRTSRDGELSPAKRVLRWEHAWSGACMFAWAEECVWARMEGGVNAQLGGAALMWRRWPKHRI